MRARKPCSAGWAGTRHNFRELAHAPALKRPRHPPLPRTAGPAAVPAHQQEVPAMFVARTLLVLALAVLPVASSEAAAPTKDEVVTRVKDAIAYYKANGRAKALAEFNRKDGRFASGQDYVDIHDLHGVCLAHPTVPEIVGKNVSDEKDANG